MAKIDEVIVQMRREIKKNEHNDIYKGAYIDYEIVEFQETKLFDNKMSVWLPKSFIEMPKPMIKIKYPGEERPQIIITDLSSTINFTFSLLEVDIPMKNVPAMANLFKTIIEKTQPKVIFYEDSTEELGENRLSWFDFKSMATDSEIYNIMYITLVDGKVMHGIFNCLYEQMKDWKDIAKQVMMSVKDLS